MRGEQIEIFPAVFFRFARAGGFEVDDARDARVDAADIQRAAGFQRDGMTGIAERGQ